MKQIIRWLVIAFLAIVCSVARGENTYAPTYVETPTYGYGNTPLLLNPGTVTPGGSTTVSTREIRGSSVFQVTYEGNVDLALKAAFEDACRIWEESIPTCPMVKIKVKVASLPTAPNPVLSTVRLAAYETANSDYSSALSPLTRVRAVTFNESNYSKAAQFTEYLNHTEIFNNYDFEITYNSDIMDEFSFSRGYVQLLLTDHYDFTTLAIRDIAKGLGYMCAFEGDNTNRRMLPLDRKPLIFEHAIIYGGQNWYDYDVFTTGPCYVPSGYYIYGDERLRLLTPPTWETGTSLSGFYNRGDVGVTKALSALMTYNQYCRHFSDYFSFMLFHDLLGWDDEVTSGHSAAPAIQDMSDVTGLSVDMVFRDGMTIADFIASVPDSMKIACNNMQNVSASTSWNENFYDLYKDYKTNSHANNSIYLLKKDGTWQKYETLSTNYVWDGSLLRADVSSDIYARNYDGYLRGMIHAKGSNGRSVDALCQLEGIPESPEIQVSSMKPDANNQYVTVYFGLKGINGISSLSVKEKVTYSDKSVTESTFDVPAFDGRRYSRRYPAKNCTVELIPIATNNVGSKTGTKYTFPIMIMVPVNPGIKFQNNHISFTLETAESDYEGNYFISSFDDFSSDRVMEGTYSDGTCVDISSLRSGSYVLQYEVSPTELKSVKFTKQ